MDVRWRQRFQNLDAAVDNLAEAIAQGVADMNQLEKEGTVQRFEVAMELCWKTAKDYLQQQGVELTTLTPRTVLKEAFAAGLPGQGQVWIDMLDMRNLPSHSYDEATFEAALKEIEARFLPAMQELQAWFRETER